MEHSLREVKLFKVVVQMEHSLREVKLLSKREECLFA
jgi:hypothetical protein